MVASALGNLLADAWYDFVYEVKLLQNQKKLQSPENNLSQEKKWASLIRIKGKQSLM